jgi:hypothetical protein
LQRGGGRTVFIIEAFLCHNNAKQPKIIYGFEDDSKKHIVKAFTAFERLQLLLKSLANWIK